jgi:hypothetical protein
MPLWRSNRLSPTPPHPRLRESQPREREGTLAYYYSLSKIFTERQVPLAPFVASATERMHQIDGNTKRVALFELAKEQELISKKEKLGPFLESEAMVEDDGIDGLAFLPPDPRESI